MQRLRRLAVGAGLAGSLTGAPARAQTTPVLPPAGSLPPPAGTPKATSLGYDVGTALVYADELVRPGTATSTGASSPRTVGLRYVVAGLTWQAPGGAGLRLVLRPDAVNRAEDGQSPPREYDDRSGDPGLQKEPTIRLADAYQLTYEASPSLGGAVGVFEGLTPAVGAYPEVLGFGLLPLLPAKFSGVRLDWRRAEAAAETAAQTGAAARGAVFSVSATLLEGNEDRGETLAGGDSSFDQGPTAHDPYHGAALDLAWAPSARFGLGLLAGTEASTAVVTTPSTTPATAVDPAAKDPRHDSVFARLTGTARFPVSGRDGKLGLDVRYLHERWTAGVADRQALAGFVTASLPAAAGVWGLLGAGYGKADRWSWADAARSGTVPLSGYQLEAGVLDELAPELTLELLATHEWRQTRTVDGRIVGGFYGDQGPGSPGGRTLLHRLGLQLSYRLNSHA